MENYEKMHNKRQNFEYFKGKYRGKYGKIDKICQTFKQTKNKTGKKTIFFKLFCTKTDICYEKQQKY